MDRRKPNGNLLENYKFPKFLGLTQSFDSVRSMRISYRFFMNPYGLNTKITMIGFQESG